MKGPKGKITAVLTAGAITSGIKAPGVTSGNGSMQSVTNQMRTKLANKTIEHVSLKTSAKMAVSRQVNGALVEGTIAAPLAEKAIDDMIDAVQPKQQQKPMREPSNPVMRAKDND